VIPIARSASLPETSSSLADSLDAGCRSLGIDVSADQQALLLEYLALLAKWNKAYNLTAVRETVEMVPRHLLDSLSVLDFLPTGRILDVGTGAGLPGIPLAILRPQQPFHLLDSNGKKTRFLFQVKTALGLDNMEVHQARAESFSTEQPFQAITSRAFTSLHEMFDRCQHLLAAGGRCLAMKGIYPAEEVAALKEFQLSCDVHALNVPGVSESRHLVVLTKQ